MNNDNKGLFLHVLDTITRLIIDYIKTLIFLACFIIFVTYISLTSVCQQVGIHDFGYTPKQQDKLLMIFWFLFVPVGTLTTLAILSSIVPTIYARIIKIFILSIFLGFIVLWLWGAAASSASP